MKFNKLHNSKSVLTEQSYMILRGVWATMRYSLADVDFSYKPVLTQLKYDNHGKVDVVKIESEHDDVLTTLRNSTKYLDDSICMMISFPMIMAQDEIGNNEKLVSCLIVYSKIGILDIFMSSNEGCNFLKYAIDKIKDMDMVEDIESALSFYSTIEVPVTCPSDMDHGYFVVEDSSGFFIQDNSSKKVAKVDDINSILKGELPKFDSDEEIKTLFKDENLTPQEMIDRMFDVRFKFKIQENFDDEFNIDESLQIEEDSDEDSDDLEWI